jgi:hypothetical protein
MKTMAAVAINKSFIFSTLGLLGIWLTFSSCQKEDLNPDYPFKVIVKTYEDSTIAANTFVEAYAPVPNAIPGGFFEGYTNEAGAISFTYNKEAIFFVRASRGPKTNYNWLGCGEVYLKANEEVVKTIYIKRKQGNNSLRGCTFN